MNIIVQAFPSHGLYMLEAVAGHIIRTKKRNELEVVVVPSMPQVM